MGKILLTHSYSLAFDPKQERIGQPWLPLGTLYAASVLKENGNDIHFYDPMFAKSINEFVPVLERESPSILIIYDDGFSYLSKMCLSNMRELAFFMIKAGRSFNTTIIVCSSDANDNYSLYIDRGADFIIMGEGENTLTELVNRLSVENSRHFDDIKGIAWKKNGKTVLNEPRELIPNPDRLPFPAWELADIERYRTTWKKKNGYFTLNLVTTRGCPYHCIWCAKPVYGNHYNSRTPRNVAEEMEFLMKNYAPDRFWFADDIFGLKPGWINEFSNELKMRELNIPFTIQSRVDLLLNKDLVTSLGMAGCKKIWLGIESGSQKILDAMQKEITVEQMYQVSPMIKAAGIDQAFFIQLGFPGETFDDINKTIRVLTDLMPEDIGISVTYPLPGTIFYETVKNKLRIKTNWKDSDDTDSLIPENFPAGFYKALHHYVHKHYRSRQAGYYLTSLLKKQVKMNYHIVRSILLFPYYFISSRFYKILLINKDHAAKELI